MGSAETEISDEEDEEEMVNEETFGRFEESDDSGDTLSFLGVSFEAIATSQIGQ